MRGIILICILIIAVEARAQTLSNARQKQVVVSGDTVIVDSLSLIPGSLYVLEGGLTVDTLFYTVNYAEATLVWKKRDSIPDTITVVYRVFPVLFSREYAFRSATDKKIMGKDSRSVYIYSEEERSQELFRIEGLNKSGSISRGITVGNNQDAVVSSSLNLQLSGRLSNNIDVAAAITDDNIPVQPEGNTQQLQEFDKVYIQLSNEKNKLVAGDFELKKPEGYFMNFYKKGQGGLYSNKSELIYGKQQHRAELITSVSGAVSKGKFARINFNGIESNQGPYRLTGAENETYIIVLSGSERIYIDGQLLKRGQSNDYVIDYNTAEITFTPRRLITKDTRIIAEFQYSNKNYARTLFYGGSQFVEKSKKAWINVYTEQDRRNQPLQQDLSEEQKKMLAIVGDDIAAALSPNVDSVPFNANEILYLKKDSTVNAVTYNNVYVWSVNPDSARYRLGFSNVGPNAGNYILSDVVSANGRVYIWVAPVNGIPQGNYEPVVLLITPKKRQLLSGGFSLKKDDKNDLFVEIAASRDDINTFSKLDKSNDEGWANAISYAHSFPVIAKASKPWKLVTAGRYEYASGNFKPVENYRAVEFNRDWNTTQLIDTSDEHNASAGITLQQEASQVINYTVRTYQRPGTYSGLMHTFHSANIYKRYMLKTDGSYLTTSGTAINSGYLRHKEDFSRHWKYIITGIGYEEEKNEIETPVSDSLTSSSFAYKVVKAYVETPDTARMKATASYNRRWDELPQGGVLQESTMADNVSASLTANLNKNNRLSIGATYRRLEVDDTLLTVQKPDESLLSRIEHQFSTAKGFITATTYYEAGSGMEQKKEFSYVEVAPGTGNFTWNDYNDDGIPQLNEFETAQFQDQASYIRVFTPTNDYIKVFTNQLNMVVNIQPGALNQNNVWSKLSFLTALRFDNKITGTSPEQALNPFLPVSDEQSLISTNASTRNTLFINKTGQVFGTDLSYNDQQVKQLLSSGIETRHDQEAASNVRVNFSAFLSSLSDLGYQVKRNNSETFSTRNYNLHIYKVEEKFSYQPGNTYRISLLYNIMQKENTIGVIGEKSLTQKSGVEFRYSSVKKGLLTTAFNIVYIDFNQPENTPLAYEMLEGLKAGVNYTWNASIQRNISNSFQLSFNYEGRKSQGLRIIHTSGVQARAFF